LGVWTTHALVVAQMTLHEKDKGNHLFLVQVRDTTTRDLASGVTIYEQGEKSVGTFASTDNGTMKLSKKRIPPSQMLAGFVSINRKGEYQTAEGTNKKHSYTSMNIIRGLMSEELGQEVAKAARKNAPHLLEQMPEIGRV
jgi:acyl-CoA oxidase